LSSEALAEDSSLYIELDTSITDRSRGIELEAKGDAEDVEAKFEQRATHLSLWANVGSVS